jgi:MoxR-like ATPase
LSTTTRSPGIAAFDSTPARRGSTLTTVQTPVPGGGSADFSQFSARLATLQSNIEAVIRGKPDVVRLALTCVLAEGHILVEDVPGVGKTSLAKALAASIDGTWKRVQFTPDLLPSDVTGVTIYNEGTRDFEFHPGPVFANVVLGDEINRASPKTQAALLEVMQENQVTVDGVRHAVPRPFVVIATQNPVEYDGTYQLPEAQRDRFLMRIQVGYPDLHAEVEIMRAESRGASVDQLGAVTTVADIQSMIDLVQRVRLDESLEQYIARLSAATRQHPELLLGVSPRGSLALSKAARAHAAVAGRDYVVPEDIKALAQPVLAHRMILTPEAEIQGRTSSELLDEIISRLDVPQGGPGDVQSKDEGLPSVRSSHLAGPATGKKKLRR